MSTIDGHNVPEGMELISREEYDKLWDAYAFLNCLRNAGVDNWCGYEEAQRMYSEEDESDE